MHNQCFNAGFDRAYQISLLGKRNRDCLQDRTPIRMPQDGFAKYIADSACKTQASRKHISSHGLV